MADGTTTLALLVAGVGLSLWIYMRYLDWVTGGWLNRAARLETDPAYRAAHLAELDARLAHRPQDAEARRERADLRRIDGNHAGVIEDLAIFLQHHPEDDTGWAELAEALLEIGNLPEARRAAGRAIDLDPDYPEYRMLRVRVELRLGDDAAAREALDRWDELERARLASAENGKRSSLPGWPSRTVLPDPILPLYRAALFLRENRIAEAHAAFQAACRENRENVEEELRREPALAALNRHFALTDKDAGEER